MNARLGALVLCSFVLTGQATSADVVTEWNTSAGDIAVAAKMSTPSTNRMMAIVQTAVFEAVNAITRRYPSSRARLDGTPDASVDAAVAAANRATLSKMVPSQQAAIDSAYQAALADIPAGSARDHGIAIGEQAAAAVLAMRADDGANAPEDYRPRTTPGTYVPTALPVVPQWPQRKPWVMTRADQFRPGPPPALTSEAWTRDYDEIKAVGGKNSSRRTAEQTDIARFWEATGPTIYLPLALSVADAPGREVTQNARLLAATSQAIDDAVIAVFDAKYHYGLWRPITAIRNGDIDGNEATARDASWLPFIDTPMHPEYPCAHCIVAASIGAVLQAEVGDGPMPTLTTTSPTAPGVVRSWTRVDDLVQEVSNARIYDGVHYRRSTEVGAAMGKKIGELAAKTLLR